MRASVVDGRQPQCLARTLHRGLSGAERGADEGPLAWIQFDGLIRTLTLGFRRILPAGWTIWGVGPQRHPSPGAGLAVRIRLPDPPRLDHCRGRPGPERLKRVTQWMLERLQAAVIEATGQPWPRGGEDRVTPFAELIEDRHNPTLRLGYGDPRSPLIAPLDHDLHLNMMIST